MTANNAFYRNLDQFHQENAENAKQIRKLRKAFQARWRVVDLNRPSTGTLFIGFGVLPDGCFDRGTNVGQVLATVVKGGTLRSLADMDRETFVADAIQVAPIHLPANTLSADDWRAFHAHARDLDALRACAGP